MMASVLPLFAMHMANELLSVPVAGRRWRLRPSPCLVAAGVRPAGNDRRPVAPDGRDGGVRLCRPDDQLHAAGHAWHQRPPWRGVLLAILLGPATGIVTMAADSHRAVSAVSGRRAAGPGLQHHQHGRHSLLAWLGAVPPGARTGRQGAAWRQYLAAWVACVVGVTAGAAMVPVEAAASGVLQVPISQFLGVMLGVHLVIGLCEGAITFAVLGLLAPRPARVAGTRLRTTRRSCGMAPATGSW